MESRRSPAAAQSAAVLGSRNARRQLRSVLTAAAEAGAYSVGFCVARGGLTGFSVYFTGDFAGAGKHTAGTAAYSCAVPHSSRLEATIASAQPTARAPAASAAPAQPAAARRRGCRAGAKRQQRRQGARERSTTTTTATKHAAPLEGGMHASRPHGDATAKDAAAPHIPPPHNNKPPSSAQHSSSLSPLALAFAPPAPPLCPSPSPASASSGEEDPLNFEPDLRHLLPHSRFSYEEQRWEYYRSYGGSFPSSSKKRPEPPSPHWPASSAVVGCVVNERRTRAAPPPPPTPRLPPSRRR